jgi:hypothetical protein
MHSILNAQPTPKTSANSPAASFPTQVQGGRARANGHRGEDIPANVTSRAGALA